MPPSTTQNSVLSLSTPLGEDELVLIGFLGREEASQPFHFQLEMASENESIKASDLVGQPIKFGVNLEEDNTRQFHGIINHLSAGDVDERNRRRYRAEVVPWLWMLNYTENCRIFQAMTVPEIIEEVLNGHEISDYEISGISEDHPKREYCVQYRESDFNFVMRLMEEEGIFYTFRHESDKHVMVLGDRAVAYEECDDSEVQYSTGTRHPNHVSSWERRYSFVPGKWAQTDYDFQQPANGTATPSSILMSNESTVIDLPTAPDFEVYDFPGRYYVKEDGRHLTRIRMQEEETEFDCAKGSSTCPSFFPLAKFALQGHDCDTENGSYVLTEVVHSARELTSQEGGSGESPQAYTNSFVCIPESVTFRPARDTPRPRIHGSQTAVVTGPDKEEIWPDEHGRVKVQFFWDREGERDENTSCWIRCAQTSAGKGWGSMFIPRIGQEVVVTFLEGDPDRPLITGVVYNAEQVPAYTLPDEKTKSYIKTNTSDGGDGYNEIRFEDLKDEEQIFVHAERNMDTRVKADCMERIGGSRHLIVGTQDEGDQLELVKGDKHLHVKGSQVERIGGDYKFTVGGGGGGGIVDLVNTSDRRERIHGNAEYIIQGTRNQILHSDSFTKVDGDNNHDCYCFNIGALHGVYMQSSMTEVWVTPWDITLYVNPNNFIKIESTGITIQGSIVQINPGSTMKIDHPVADPPGTKKAEEASPKEPTEADDSVTGHKSAPDSLS